MTLRAAVIGGGISGLATAVRVAGLGHRVTLVEGDDQLGGLGSTFAYRGGHLERFYHCILPSDSALLRFIGDLGLGNDLLWRRTRMGFMYEREIYALNTALDLLRFRPLSPVERIRMGLLGVRARVRGLDPGLDDTTAAEWVQGLVGTRAFEIVWKPLLAAKIGDGYAGLPALWLSSRMNREKSTGPETKGSLVRGYRSLIDAFEQHLRDRGVIVRLGTRVEALERSGERMLVRYDRDAPECFDFVVSTCPLVRFQRLTQTLNLPTGIAELELDYQGVICGVFLLEKPLSPYYWMPWVKSGATAQGVVEMSNLVPLERSQGLHVTYLVNYVHRDSDFFKKTDQELLGLYRRDLENLFPNTVVADQFLFRAPFVEPIWTVGYRSKRPPSSVIPGRLYLACTAQLYPRVNSWNSCCQVVEEMLVQLATETRELRSA